MKKNRSIISYYNKIFLSVLCLAQGIHIFIKGKFFNFNGQPFVDTGNYRYFLSVVFIALGAHLLYRILNPVASHGLQQVSEVESSKPSRKPWSDLPLRLKITTAYFFLYAILVELTVIIHWDEWTKYLEGKSVGSQLGSLMHGPLLGLFFITSAAGLIFQKKWGRKLAVFILIYAAFLDARSFAWGRAENVPSDFLYYGSLAGFLVWNGIWLSILYSQKVTDILRE